MEEDLNETAADFNDNWAIVPDELLLRIFSYLPAGQSLGAIALVCSSWNRVVADKTLKRGSYGLVGHHVIDLAHFKITRSIESLAGRTPYTSWRMYDKRFAHDNYMLWVPRFNTVSGVELATGKVLYEHRVGAAEVIFDDYRLFLVGEHTVTSVDRQSGRMLTQADDFEWNLKMNTPRGGALVSWPSIKDKCLVGSFVVLLTSNQCVFWLDKESLMTIHELALQSENSNVKLFPITSAGSDSPDFLILGPDPAGMQYLQEKTKTRLYNSRGELIQVIEDAGVLAGTGNQNIIVTQGDVITIYTLKNSQLKPRMSIKAPKTRYGSPALVEDGTGKLYGIILLHHSNTTNTQWNTCFYSINNDQYPEPDNIPKEVLGHNCTWKISTRLSDALGEMQYQAVACKGTVIVCASQLVDNIKPYVSCFNISTGKQIWSNNVTFPPEFEYEDFERHLNTSHVQMQIRGGRVAIRAILPKATSGILVLNAATGKREFLWRQDRSQAIFNDGQSDGHDEPNYRPTSVPESSCALF